MLCHVVMPAGQWEVPLVAWKDKTGAVTAVPAACRVDNEQDAFTLLRDKSVLTYTHTGHCSVMHTNRWPGLMENTL